MEQVLAGGEALSVEHVRRAQAVLAGTQLINGYGPTEGTTFTCCHAIARDAERGADRYRSAPDRQHAGLRARRADGAGAARRARRSLHRWDGWRGATCGGPSDGRAVHSRPVRRRGRGTAEPDRGPGTVLGDGTLEFLGRATSSEGAGLPHRARRDRGRTARAGGGARSGRGGARGRARRQAAGRLRRARRGGAPAAQASADAGEQYTVEQIQQWESVFEIAYGQGEAAEADFNITGWNSSYTGAPIPPDQMREWVEQTVARLDRLAQASAGDRVRDGLLLLRVAPGCERYVGTDFSRVAVEQVRGETERRGLSHVELLERGAEDFTGMEAGSFDLVVINSVVQYFPNVEYLIEVLEGAARVVRPGGAVFVGDVRSLPLMDAFHASVELWSADGRAPAKQVRERAERARRHEQELVLAPELFAGFAGQLEGGGWAQVEPKRGEADNELKRYRYDVTL